MAWFFGKDNVGEKQGATRASKEGTTVIKNNKVITLKVLNNSEELKNEDINNNNKDFGIPIDFGSPVKKNK
ncbi:MAG: hypothetical protein PHY80_01320 [Rickettsiales bacterium]|nr:hypothetical protein [Rickettsiales bacterium]